MRKALLALAFMELASCTPEGALTKVERALIGEQHPLMRVLTIENEEDSLLLRSKSRDFLTEDIASDTYRELAEKMVATVTSPEQDGVGIAGPQVGLLRRVVAVQRFDKEGEPFEVYPNIRIVEFRGEKEPGGEGCLSVPGRRGDVLRWQEVVIEYTDPHTLETVRETIDGFTAVIFQHETDHLDGILYIDHLDSEQ